MSKKNNKKMDINKIPSKKQKTDFDIDNYIETEIENYAKNFREKSKKEFGLLDKLVKAFLDNKKETFRYEYDIYEYELKYLEQKAIDIFKHYVTSKGYNFDIKKVNLDPDSIVKIFTITVN